VQNKKNPSKCTRNQFKNKTKYTRSTTEFSKTDESTHIENKKKCWPGISSSYLAVTA
jgi:hypothetical protein